MGTDPTTRHSWKRMARLGASWLLLAGGCASTSAASAVMVRRDARLSTGRWVLLPLMNYSEAPRADEAARSILSTLLRARGIKTLADSPAASAPDQPMPDLDGRVRLEKAVAWAKKEKFTFGVTGSVNEWRYRASPDGSPAVGVSLDVVDIESGQVLWTASGARSGPAGGTASGTAQQLLLDLLDRLETR
jgi:polysaccharide biosynthesis protein PelC